MLFHNISCHLIFAVFLLQANIFDFFLLFPVFQGNKGQRRHKRRSEHVTDRVSNGSTHGEASKQTQSQGILKRKMKHLSSETNIDRITDAKRVWTLPSLEGAAASPHLSTSSTSSWESEKKVTDDDPSDIRRDTHT